MVLVRRRKIRKIELSQGKYASVSDVDFDRVNEHNWWLMFRKRNGSVFKCIAVTQIRSGGKIKYLTMHKLILGERKNMEIDHIDGDTLNNCVENLRFVTHRQNTANTDRKGYCKLNDGRKSPWRVVVAGRLVGHFAEESSAKKAYTDAFKKEYGFVKLHTNVSYEELHGRGIEQKRRKGCISKYKYVTFNKSIGLWRAQKSIAGKWVFNKDFKTEKDAAEFVEMRCRND